MQVLLGALLLHAYGSYAAVLRTEFGWSKTLFSAAYSMSQVESGLLGPVQGRLIDRLGPRVITQVGVIMFAGGFMLFSQINSPITFFLAFFLIAVGSSLAGFMAFTVSVVNCFERRRALALGIMFTGIAVGGLIVPAVVWSLESFGWRTTAFASGVIVLVVGLPLTLILRHHPAQFGDQIDGRKPDDDSAAADESRRETVPARRDFTAREALRTTTFWYLSLGHAAALLVVSAVLVHMVLHVHENLGYSLGVAGAMTALMTAMMIVGLLSGGLVGDRGNKRAIIVACMAGHASGLLLLAYATSLWMVAIFAILHGLAWGARAPLLQAIRADYFGRTSYGTIMGFSAFVAFMGMMLGPLIAGVLADETGGYKAGFTVLAVLVSLGAVFFILVRPPRLPGEPADAEEERPKRLAVKPLASDR